MCVSKMFNLFNPKFPNLILVIADFTIWNIYARFASQLQTLDQLHL